MTVRFSTITAIAGALGTLLFASIASAQGVRLVNESSWNINNLYLSPTGNARWGPDQLGQHILDSNGGSVDIPGACGYYDLRFVDEDADECVISNIHLCNEAVSISDQDLLHCVGATQVQPAAPVRPVVRLVNQSNWNINNLYLSPTGYANWGPDQLGQHVLSAGGGSVDIPAACGNYDLRFVDEDADECVVGNIYLCNEAVSISDRDLLHCVGATQVQPAAPVRAVVRLVNQSNWNINNLFLSPTGNARWGPDQLGQNILSANGGWVEIPAACGYYDLRFLDEDADECVVSNIHLCNESVSISNSDLLQCTAASQ